ncbi:hypothetical protein ScPMuIL_001033 [Solemya velum]
MKVIYDKEQTGPVTAVAGVNGLLVSATGQKIYIWELKDNDLKGVAFIDTQIYIVSLSTIKSLIMAGDVLKSISLFRYQEDLRVLSLVSRDVKNLEVFTTDYMVDNNHLVIIVSDRMKNILYTYQPEASLDGSLGYFLPLSERSNKFQSQQICLIIVKKLKNHVFQYIQMYMEIQMFCRTQRSTFPELRNNQRNILDGELIWKFTHLSLMERAEISKRIGTTSNQILDDLREIDRMTAHF